MFCGLACIQSVRDGYVGVVLVNSKVQPSVIDGFNFGWPFVSTVLKIPVGLQELRLPPMFCGTNGTLFAINNTLAQVRVVNPITFVESTGLDAIININDAIKAAVVFSATEYFSEFCSTLRPQDPMQANLFTWANDVELYLERELLVPRGLKITKFLIPRKPDAPNSDVDEHYDRQAAATSRVQAATAEREAITAEALNKQMETEAAIGVERQQTRWAVEQMILVAEANATADMMRTTTVDGLLQQLGPGPFEVYLKYEALRVARSAAWVLDSNTPLAVHCHI